MVVLMDLMQNYCILFIAHLKRWGTQFSKQKMLFVKYRDEVAIFTIDFATSTLNKCGLDNLDIVTNTGWKIRTPSPPKVCSN